MTAPTWDWRGGPTGRLLKVVYTTVRRELEALTRDAGLTPTQWSALGYLLHFPDATHSDLERVLLVEAPSVTSVVKGLEQRGWVIRRPDPDDARTRRIRLTAEGEEIARRTRHLGEEADRRAFADVPSSEISALRELLARVAEAIGAVPRV